MTDPRVGRVGENEALFRILNERIEAMNEAFATITDDFEIVCECGNAWCVDQIKVPLGVYEQTRANPAHFILKHGHEAADVELVVESTAEYVVVEKKTGMPTRLARGLDPRS